MSGTLIPTELVPSFEKAMNEPVTYGPTYITNHNVPPKPLKAWLVTYEGLWMGGTAVVLADCSDTACDMVRDDNQTARFDNVQAREVGSGDKASVLYNWNGDY